MVLSLEMLVGAQIQGGANEKVNVGRMEEVASGELHRCT